MDNQDNQNSQNPLNSPKQKSALSRAWDFLKVRKIWWIPPLVILLILFLLSIFAGNGISVGNVYAPI